MLIFIIVTEVVAFKWTRLSETSSPDPNPWSGLKIILTLKFSLKFLRLRRQQYQLKRDYLNERRSLTWAAQLNFAEAKLLKERSWQRGNLPWKHLIKLYFGTRCPKWKKVLSECKTFTSDAWIVEVHYSQLIMIFF